MTEFRPISLCNVSYKIISKIMCKRLKKFLPKLISETQSAFVARRLISDNILVAQEIFHAMRTNPICKSKFVAIKTDMNKAYDRMEWNFLEALMLKMGFAAKWVTWIKWCISSVSYQVVLNGEAKGNIKPTRGLRQGDPLSPFLFIILTEALISQIKGAENEGRLTGLKIAQASPAVSHLLFADDSLFFCKADVQQCAELMKIITNYGMASGQQLNTSKSSILFGSKVSVEVKQEIKAAVGIQKEGGMGTYLGLPEKICGSKRQVFTFVRDRLNIRINCWTAKFLSKGGKEILIKSVAQALPTYVMSCFLLPQDILNKLKSAIAKFWWSTKQNNRGLHWMAWDKLCKPADKGGLGFRDIKNFNLALLAKQLWRLLHHPESLLARVLKGRYFRYTNPLEISSSNAPSYGWRSMIAARDLLKKGLRRTIGSGFNTRVWFDDWIPSQTPRLAQDNGTWRNPKLYVNHIIDHNTGEWIMDLIRNIFSPEDVNLILNIKPSHHIKPDGYCWTHTNSGLYTVKSGYELASLIQEESTEKQILEPNINPLLTKVRSLKAPRKIKHFLWQCLTGCVAVCSRLSDRHCGNDRSCPRCGGDDESINHLLFQCPPALQTWALSDIPSGPGRFTSESIYENFDFLLSRALERGVSKQRLAKFPWIMWYVWKARNDKLFNGVEISPLDSLHKVTQEGDEWLVAQEVTKFAKERDRPQSMEQEEINRLHKPRCQVDASWAINQSTFGGGLILEMEDGSTFTGSLGSREVPSPLHAEFRTLLWAMSYTLRMSYNKMHFESDFLQMVKLIEEEEFWPSLASEWDEFSRLRSLFNFFSISFIPRELNSRADLLAKGARAKGSISSHVNILVPPGLAQTNLFEPV
ncbi:uncharacterized protein LOC117127923 [Brassica rapa]|uniref:uncharacterized protein LOC117127923 n=1 Tax=Brassica campestris TaxID=3711 RepID=UPI00142E8D95|nr:uncharacterized protein LOC117127923 [Brassica rapa]